MKRIEVEDLLPGDVFEYEHDDYAWHTTEHRRVWLPTKVKRDTVRKPPVKPFKRVISDKTTNPDCLGGNYLTREEGDGISSLVRCDGTDGLQNLLMKDGACWYEPGKYYKDAVWLVTETGTNNHGYVVLPPKTVVVLIERKN